MHTSPLGIARELAVCCSAGFGIGGRAARCPQRPRRVSPSRCPCGGPRGPPTGARGMSPSRRAPTTIDAARSAPAWAFAAGPNRKLSSRRAGNCHRCPRARWESPVSRRSAAAPGSAPRRPTATSTKRGPTPPRCRTRTRNCDPGRTRGVAGACVPGAERKAQQPPSRQLRPTPTGWLGVANEPAVSCSAGFGAPPSAGHLPTAGVDASALPTTLAGSATRVTFAVSRVPALGRRTKSSAAAPARASYGHQKPIGGGRLLQRRVRLCE